MGDDTGLDYLRARYYDSQGGAFLTEDSYPGEDTDPLSQNRYSYVQNNPVNYTDPSGHFWNNIKKGWNYVKKKASNAWNGVKRVASNTWNTVKRVASNTWNGVKSFASKAWNVTKSAFNHATNWVSTQYNRAVNWGSRQWNKVQTAYNSAGDYVQTKYQQAAAQIEAKRQQVVRSAYALATGRSSSPTIREGMNLLRNWGTALQNTLKHVCTTAERVKNQVVDFVKNVDWKKVAVTAAAIGVGIALTVATGGLGAPVAMAIGGAASGAIISGYDAYSSGQRGWELVGSIAKGAGTGAISGLIGGQLVGAGASLATNVTQNIGNQAVRQVAKIGVESAVETAIDTGIDLVTGNKITGQTVAMNFALNTFTNGAGSVSPKKAPKADVVTTKPTGGRIPMTVENLQMFAEKPKVNLVTSKDTHFNNWLNKGDFDNTVYFAMKNNEPVYTGITKQSLEKRQNQHVKAGKDIDMLVPVYDNLTRNQARAHEQNLIENPIGNSNKLNKINSISPKNNFHDEAIMWAQNNK